MPVRDHRLDAVRAGAITAPMQMFRGRCQGVCLMCNELAAWTMVATQPHEEDSMASFQMKLIRGLFRAAHRRERVSRLDPPTNADRAVLAALPDTAPERSHKGKGRAQLGVARIALLGAVVALG